MFYQLKHIVQAHTLTGWTQRDCELLQCLHVDSVCLRFEHPNIPPREICHCTEESGRWGPYCEYGSEAFGKSLRNIEENQQITLCISYIYLMLGVILFSTLCGLIGFMYGERYERAKTAPLVKLPRRRASTIQSIGHSQHQRPIPTTGMNQKVSITTNTSLQANKLHPMETTANLPRIVTTETIAPDGRRLDRRRLRPLKRRRTQSLSMQDCINARRNTS